MKETSPPQKPTNLPVHEYGVPQELERVRYGCSREIHADELFDPADTTIRDVESHAARATTDLEKPHQDEHHAHGAEILSDRTTTGLTPDNNRTPSPPLLGFAEDATVIVDDG